MIFIFLLFMFWGINCEVCPLIDSLDNGLSAFGHVFDNTLSDFEKFTSLVSNVSNHYSGLPYNVIKAFSPAELFDLASLVNFQRSQSSPVPTNWTYLSPAQLRVGVERTAISLNTTRADYYETYIGMLQLKEVVLLACGESNWLVETIDDLGPSSGCYEAPNLTHVKNDSSYTEVTCISACREENFLFSAVNLNWDCLCDRIVDNLGTFLGKADECQTGLKIQKTGLGNPTQVFLDPENTSQVFNLTELDGVDIENNVFLGFREVVYPFGDKEDTFFIGVYAFSVVLYRLSKHDSGTLFYEYVDHKRWDGVKYIKGSNSWIMKFVDNDFIPGMPARTPAILQDAVAFEYFPGFVTLNDTLDLDSPIDYTNRDTVQASINNVTNLAGRPIPGGAWFHHILIYHSDPYPYLDRPSVKGTLLRIEDRGLHHLINAKSESSFGSFLVDNAPEKYPISVATRVVGRKTFIFVGTYNDIKKTSSIHLYEVIEQEFDITTHAKSGRYLLKEHSTMELDNLVALEAAEFLHSYLLVLDVDVHNDTSRIQVFKIQSYINFKKVDEYIIEDSSYHSLNFMKVQGKGMIYLASPNQTVLLELSRRGMLTHNSTVVPTEGSNSVPYIYKALGGNAVFPTVLNTQSKIKFYNQHGDELSMMTAQLRAEYSYDHIICVMRMGMPACLLTSNEADYFDIVTFDQFFPPTIDNTKAVMFNWEAATDRINNAVAKLNETFQTQKAELENHLMVSGSVVTAEWSIAQLNSVQLHLPANALNESGLSVKSEDHVNSLYNGSEDFQPAMNIMLSVVEIMQQHIGDIIITLQEDLKHALTLDKMSIQVLSSLSLDTVEADFIKINDSILVNSLSSANANESLEHLIEDMYWKNDVKAIVGTKTFNNKVQIGSLLTDFLSDLFVSLKPSNCLLHHGEQVVPVHKTLNGAVEISSLSMTDAILTDGNPNVSVHAEDINLLKENGIHGYFFFKDVKTTELNSSLSFVLPPDDILNIIKIDEEAHINGTLEIITSKASGGYINVIDGVINGHNLYDLSKNVLLINCIDCNSDVLKIENIDETITFTGSVTALKTLKVENVNDVNFEDYVKKEEFSEEVFNLTGKVNFLNEVSVNKVIANHFNNLTLGQLMTISTGQVIHGVSSFEYSVEFKIIGAVNADSVPMIDGEDFRKLFLSNLQSVSIGSPWLETPLLSDMEFVQLVLQSDSELKLAGEVNSMNVFENLNRVVIMSYETTYLGNKTFISEVNLDSVNNTKLVTNNLELSTDSIVNTKNTESISGKKRFVNQVEFNNIFLVDDSTVNEFDMLNILKCVVDIGTGDTDYIDIFYPIRFVKVVSPSMNLMKSPEVDECRPLSNISVISVANMLLNDPLTDFNSDDLINHLADRNVSVTIGMNSLDDSAIAEDILLSFLLREVGYMPNMGSKIAQLHQYIRNTYGLNVEDMDLLQSVNLLCRNPTLNSLDPSKDLALLDYDNVFCSDNIPCVQEFMAGFSAYDLVIPGSIHMPPLKTFGVDLSTLEQERTSKSRFNLMEGSYTFENISLKENGDFSGQLLLDFNGSSVSSRNYREKFLNVDSLQDQIFKKKVFTWAFTANVIDENTEIEICMSSSCTSFDLPDILSNSYGLDEDLQFENLTFMDSLELTTNTVLSGLIDDIDLISLAEDIVITGPTETVQCGNNEIKLEGTESKLIFTGDKLFKLAPDAESVVSLVENDFLYPLLFFYQCSVSKSIVGLGSGNITYSGSVNSHDDCHEKCRSEQCNALSYNNATKRCDVMSSLDFVDSSETGFTTDIYACWMFVKSMSGLYLSISANITDDYYYLVTSEDPQYWFFEYGLLVHRDSGLAVTIPEDSQPGDLVQLRPRNDSSSSQYIEYTSPTNFEIMSSNNTSLRLLELANKTIVLESGSGTIWNVGMRGVNFQTLQQGVPVTRFLTKHTNQEIDGSITFLGDVHIEGQMTNDFIGGLTISEVARRYSYDTMNQAHKINHDFVSDGNLTVNNLRATTIGSRNFESFLEDAVKIYNNETQVFTGTKNFSNIEILNPDLTVNGLVNGFNLNEKHTLTAFIDASAESFTFLEKNTFLQGHEVYMEGDFTSKTNLVLSDPTIENVIDLDELKRNAIPISSDSIVDVSGTVRFNQSLFSGGNITVDQIHSSLSSFQTTDLILTSDTFINTTVNGLVRNFSEVTATSQVTAIGKLFDFVPEDFLDVLYKDGDQTITGSHVMTGKVVLKSDSMYSGEIDSHFDNAVFLGENSTLIGNFTFNDLVIQELNVHGLLNGVDFDGMVDNTFTLASNQTISKEWTLNPLVEFEKEIFGLGDGYEEINGQLVSELQAVSSVYERVQAVKLSAQAEAATMCDYVSDLQLSYLGNQGVEKYKPLNSTSVPTDCMDSQLVYLKELVYIILVCDSEISMYSGDMVMEKLIFQPLQSQDAPKRIEAVIAINNSTDDNFDCIILISSNPIASGLEVFRFKGDRSGDYLSLQKVGDFDGISSAVVQGEKLFLLSYTDSFESKIDILEMDYLRNCDTNCNDPVLTSVYTSDTGFTQSLPEIQRIEVVALDGSSEILFAISEYIVAQNLVRIVHLSPVLQGNVQSYTLKSSFHVSTETGDFTLINANGEVYLITAGSSLDMVLLDTVNEDTVSVGKEFTNSNIKNVKRQPSILGEKNKFYAESSDGAILFYQYAGIDGVRTTGKLDTDGSIKISNYLLITINDLFKSNLVYLTDDKMTLVEGVFSNPVKQIKMDCPYPEITDGLQDPM